METSIPEAYQIDSQGRPGTTLDYRDLACKCSLPVGLQRALRLGARLLL
jgi:hypothetical protein